MHSIHVSNLEKGLYKSISKLRQDKTPFELRQDLYNAALKHAHDFLKKKQSNLKNGFEERKEFFSSKNAKRYSEIAFVTKPIDTDEVSQIAQILEKNFLPKIQSHINSIGPAVLKLKSNKYIIVIFLAFFPPTVSIRKFLSYFPDLRSISLPATNFKYLVSLINKFRRMIKFNDFEDLPPSTKRDSYKTMQFYKSSFASQRSTELFCWLFTDCRFIDLMTEMWTDFSYSSEKEKSEHILDLHFYRNEEEYVYQIHLQLPKEGETDLKNNAIFERNIDLNKLLGVDQLNNEDNNNELLSTLNDQNDEFNKPKELDLLNKQEEQIQQEKEQLKQQEEQLQQEKEQLQQQEEQIKQDELTKQEESLKEAEEKLKQEEERLKQEELKQQEEHLKEVEDQLNEQEERLKQEQQHQQEEELKQQEKEIKQKEELFDQQEKLLKEKEELLVQKEEELKQEEKLQDIEDKLNEQEERLKHEEMVQHEKEARQQEPTTEEQKEPITTEEQLKQQQEHLNEVEEELKQEEERLKQEQEQHQKEEELKQQEERLRQEEDRLKEEQLKQKEEELKQQEERLKQDEEQHKQEEDLKKQEDELKQKEEELRQEEERLKQEEEQHKQEEELRQQEEKLRQEDDRLKEEELKRQEEELKKVEDELKQQEEQLKQQQQQQPNQDDNDDLDFLISQLNDDDVNEQQTKPDEEKVIDQNENIVLNEQGNEQKKERSLVDLMNDDDDAISKSLSNESFDNIKDGIISHDSDKNNMPSGSENNLNTADNEAVYEDDDGHGPAAVLIDEANDDNTSSTILLHPVNDDKDGNFKPVDEYSQIVRDGNDSFSSDEEIKIDDNYSPEQNLINSSIAKLASDALLPDGEKQEETTNKATENANEATELAKSPSKNMKLRSTRKASPTIKGMHTKKTSSSNLKTKKAIKTVPNEFNANESVPPPTNE